MWQRAILALCLGVALAVGEAHAQAVMYQLDASMNNVVALNHIFLNDQGCTAGGQVVGRITKREFGSSGIVPSRFVLERMSGERMFINVPEISIDTMSRVDIAWVVRGLQTFLREGQSVVAGVKLCGNAPIMMLDSLKPR